MYILLASGLSTYNSTVPHGLFVVMSLCSALPAVLHLCGRRLQGRNPMPSISQLLQDRGHRYVLRHVLLTLSLLCKTIALRLGLKSQTQTYSDTFNISHSLFAISLENGNKIWQELKSYQISWYIHWFWPSFC